MSIQTDCPNNDNVGGDNKLLILRYSTSELIHNAATAVANAVQEPGIVSTLALSKRNLNRGVLPSIRIPHLYDALRYLHHFYSPEVTNDEVNTSRHMSMCGVESEFELFMKMKPKVFFINCQVVVDLDFGQNGDPKARHCNIVIPVILRGGYYYIIVGEEHTPVYCVKNPRERFFTSQGTQLLKCILCQNYSEYGKYFNFHINEEGRQEAYFIPNAKQNVEYSTASYSDYSNNTIGKMFMFPLVEAPIVPTNSKLSVQIIHLNDNINIVDI